MLQFETDIILENERVKLSPLNMEHFDYLTPIVLDNPNLLKFSPPKFGTPELLLEYIQSNIALRKGKAKYPFVIFDKVANAFAGSTSFLNISMANKRLEIGSSWIGQKYQQTGLNRNCKFLLMQYAFETLDIERLEFRTDKRNLQSQEAIKKIGGHYEGTLRSHTLMSDGYRRDTICYSVLKNEWPDIKQEVFKRIQ